MSQWIWSFLGDLNTDVYILDADQNCIEACNRISHGKYSYFEVTETITANLPSLYKINVWSNSRL